MTSQIEITTRSDETMPRVKSCLEEEQQVNCRRDDVGGDDDPVAGLLDRGEDADDGAGGEQEHRHGGELPSVPVAVVGDDLG